MSSEKKVSRILVAPEVKVTFCKNKAKLEHWGPLKDQILRKLRPWFGHRDHAHVKLKCPPGEKYCMAKEHPIKKGNGCKEALTWLPDPAHIHRRPLLKYKQGRNNGLCWKKKENKNSYTYDKDYNLIITP